MVHGQNTKVVQVQAPKAIVNNTSYSPNSVDCKDWDYCEFHVSLGATDIALTALKIQESDDDGSSDAYADVTGTVMGTDNNQSGSASTLPSATDDNKIFIFSIDCRKRNRYLKPVITVGNGSTGAFVAVTAVLSRGAIGPTDAAGRGASQIMRV